MVRQKISILVLGLMIVSGSLWADEYDVAREEAQRQAQERARINQQNQNIDNRREEMERVVPFKGGATTFDPNKELVIEEGMEGSCYTFKSIEVSENTVVSDKAIKKITGKYLDKCITINIAQEMLMEEIVVEYHKKGYILAVPYLPAQNLRQGVLRIVIKEGILEDIEYDKEILSKYAVRLAFIGTIGKPVNMRYLEQALEMLNGSGAYRTTMDLKPGTEVGQSILVLNATKSVPISISVGATNDYNTLERKSFPKMEARTTANLSVGNIIGNDTLGISGSYTFKEDMDVKQGSFGVNYSIPIGYWTLSYNNNNDMYKSIVRTFNDTYVSNGLTMSNSFEIRRTLSRDQSYILKAFVKPQMYSTQNYFDGILLKASSYNLYYVDLGLEYQYFSRIAILYSTLTYVRGEAILGEKKQGRNENYIPQNSFDIVRFNFNATVPFWGRFTYNNRLATQYSKDTLYAVNDFVVVSSQGVRGYDGITASYNAGVTNQNDVTIDIVAFDNMWVRKISFLVGADMGAPVDEIDFRIPLYKGRPLMAWYSELKTQGRVNLSIGYGRPIMPIKVEGFPSGHEVVRFSINFSY